jgi:hypothetical protein
VCVYVCVWVWLWDVCVGVCVGGCAVVLFVCNNAMVVLLTVSLKVDSL